jgi:hypothetical protein
VVGRLGDLEVPADLRDALTLAEQLVGLGELVDDLLGAVSCRCRFIAVSSSLPILGHRTRTAGGSGKGQLTGGSTTRQWRCMDIPAGSRVALNADLRAILEPRLVELIALSTWPRMARMSKVAGAASSGPIAAHEWGPDQASRGTVAEQ